MVLWCRKSPNPNHVQNAWDGGPDPSTNRCAAHLLRHRSRCFYVSHPVDAPINMYRVNSFLLWSAGSLL